MQDAREYLKNHRWLFWLMVMIGGLIGGLLFAPIWMGMMAYAIPGGPIESNIRLFFVVVALLCSGSAIGGLLGSLIVGLTLGEREAGFAFGYALIGIICGIAGSALRQVLGLLGLFLG